MGCGASSNAERPRARRNRRGSDESGSDDDVDNRRRRTEEESASDSDGSSESRSDFDENDTVKVETHHLADRDAYKTTHMDKLWQVKVDILQSGQHQRMSIDAFCKSLGLAQRDAYKALDVFEQLSDERGQLRLEKIAQLAGWSPGKNLTMARIMDSFDEDRNGSVDFCEFLVLSKMFHGHFGQVDRARFWWWVALYTDQDSVMGGERDVETVERGKAERMMRHDARGLDRDGVRPRQKQLQDPASDCQCRICVSVARVPSQSVCRFVRDALMSAGQLREGAKSKFQGTEFIANPAPSKVLNKVRAAMREEGLGEALVFHQFHDLLYRGHPHFGAVLDSMHCTLHKVLLSGMAPPFPGQLQLMKLRAFFYGKVAEFAELEAEYEEAEGGGARTARSHASSQSRRWQHDTETTARTPRTQRSWRAASNHTRSHPTMDVEGGGRGLAKAHTAHHGRKREAPAASEAMQKHQSYRHLIKHNNEHRDPRYDTHKAREKAGPRSNKARSALEQRLQELDT